MTHFSNSDLFKKIREGDEFAFSLLFDQYYTQLCYFAVSYLHDLDLSRSLVQQFFIELWVKREKISVNKSVKSYLYNSIRNAAIDYLRKEKIKTNLDSIEDLFQVPFRDIVEEAEVNSQINTSINELPEKCREVYILCRQEGLKYSEVAKHLNISVKTVEMQMGIAIRKLRDKLTGC